MPIHLPHFTVFVTAGRGKRLGHVILPAYGCSYSPAALAAAVALLHAPYSVDHPFLWPPSALRTGKRDAIEEAGLLRFPGTDMAQHVLAHFQLRPLTEEEERSESTINVVRWLNVVPVNERVRPLRMADWVSIAMDAALQFPPLFPDFLETDVLVDRVADVLRPFGAPRIYPRDASTPHEKEDTQ